MKKWMKATLYIAGFFTLNTVCRGLTDDFSMDHLVRPSPKNSKWARTDEPVDIKEVLAQKYTYLGKGKQAYVFVSEDGTHVFKLFKPHFPYFHYHLFGKPCKLGVSKLPFAKSFFEKRYAMQCEEQKENEFQSYVNSFELLKEETQLEYLHLAQTDHLQHKLQLYDKIGILREVDLDNTCFLIQKKTDLLYPTLASLIKKGETEKAKELIQSFVDLSFRFIIAGIDNPTTVDKNFGCIDLKPVQIDVGRVLVMEQFEKTGPKIDQIYYSVHHMKKWLTPKSKALCLFLEETVETQKNTYTKELHETSL
ncbi:MAG: hypothetical protein V4489_01040 [Chlamydiota bacterium]